MGEAAEGEYHPLIAAGVDKLSDAGSPQSVGAALFRRFLRGDALDVEFGFGGRWSGVPDSRFDGGGDGRVFVGCRDFVGDWDGDAQTDEGDAVEFAIGIVGFVEHLLLLVTVKC